VEHHRRELSAPAATPLTGRGSDAAPKTRRRFGLAFADAAVALFAAALLSACSGATGGSPAPGGLGGMEAGAVDGSAAGAGGNDAGLGGTGGQDTGGPDGSGTGGSGAGIDLRSSPQYYRFIRLTNAQWASSVQDILRLPAPSGLESGFETPVAGTTDFSNNELVLDVSQRSWSDFQSASETLADQVTASDAALAAVYPGTDATGFILAFGRRAFRRLLTLAELQAYTALYTTGTTMSGTKSPFAKGAALVIRGMLQSPYFLYRAELGAAGAPLNSYEMAAKLSLWLRGTSPSDSLLDSASGPGNLDTADGAAALAETMLGEPEAIAVMRQFHGQLLHFDRFGTISKIGVPTYSDALRAEYQEASYLFFDKIFAQGLGLKDVFTSTSGFMGPRMAALYGVTPPFNVYFEHDLGPNRAGYFSQLPFLTLYGLNADPDSIHRGVSLNLDVLCAALGPPAAALPQIPPLQPGQTDRQRISTLTACGGSCHNGMINPLGFAFEHFDGMGQYRDTENGGLPIDSSGSYDFVDGTRTFSGAPELMQIMAATQQTHQCYAKKLASFALQRDVVSADTALVGAMAAASLAPGGSVKQVMLELVKSDAFRTRAGGVP
jgi:hypothetical protein